MIYRLHKLEKDISVRYETLSERLQQVAKYALAHKSSIAFNTIAVIAQETDVPPSTLIGFAGSLSLLDLMENLSEQDLNKALNMLANAQNIFVIALGRSCGFASYFNYSLNHLNLKQEQANSNQTYC